MFENCEWICTEEVMCGMCYSSYSTIDIPVILISAIEMKLRETTDEIIIPRVIKGWRSHPYIILRVGCVMHISKIDRSGQTRPIIKEPNDDVKKKHTKNDFKFAKKKWIGAI